MCTGKYYITFISVGRSRICKFLENYLLLNRNNRIFQVYNMSSVCYICNLCDHATVIAEEATTHLDSHSFCSEKEKLRSISVGYIQSECTSESFTDSQKKSCREQSSDITLESQISAEMKDKKIWSRDNTLLLIELCKKYDEEFQNTIKKHVWHKIAMALKQKCKLEITAQQCDTKWKGLVATYKQIQKHNNTSGKDYKFWEYYDLLNELLHKRPEMSPVATCSSRRGLTTSTENNEDETACSSVGSSPSTSRSAFSSFSSTPSSSFTSSFSRKRKSGENSIERRHQERMQRQDKYLELLQRITTCYEQKLNKP